MGGANRNIHITTSADTRGLTAVEQKLQNISKLAHEIASTSIGFGGGGGASTPASLQRAVVGGAPLPSEAAKAAGKEFHRRAMAGGGMPSGTQVGEWYQRNWATAEPMIESAMRSVGGVVQQRAARMGSVSSIATRFRHAAQVDTGADALRQIDRLLKAQGAALRQAHAAATKKGLTSDQYTRAWEEYARIEDQVNALNAQRTAMQQQQTVVQQQNAGNAEISGAIGGLVSRYLPFATGAGAVLFGASQIESGYRQYMSTEPGISDLYKQAANASTSLVDFSNALRSTGTAFGYSAAVTTQAAQTLTAAMGQQGTGGLTSTMQSVFSFARAQGISPGSAAGGFAMAAQLGVTSGMGSMTPQQFAGLLSNAISQGFMQGRPGDVMSALLQAIQEVGARSAVAPSAAGTSGWLAALNQTGIRSLQGAGGASLYAQFGQGIANPGGGAAGQWMVLSAIQKANPKLPWNEAIYLAQLGNPAAPIPGTNTTVGGAQLQFMRTLFPGANFTAAGNPAFGQPGADQAFWQTQMAQYIYGIPSGKAGAAITAWEANGGPTPTPAGPAPQARMTLIDRIQQMHASMAQANYGVGRLAATGVGAAAGGYGMLGPGAAILSSLLLLRYGPRAAQGLMGRLGGILRGGGAGAATAEEVAAAGGGTGIAARLGGFVGRAAEAGGRSATARMMGRFTGPLGALLIGGGDVISALMQGGPHEGRNIGAGIGHGAGFWGGAAAGAALAAPLDPVTAGLASVVGGLIGGFGGSGLGGLFGGMLGGAFDPKAAALKQRHNQYVDQVMSQFQGATAVQTMTVQTLQVQNMQSSNQPWPGGPGTPAPAPGGITNGRDASGAGGSYDPTRGYQLTPWQVTQAAMVGQNATGVPAQLLSALSGVEDPGRYSAARSSAGAIGLFQFLPGTAQGFGIDPTNPDQSAVGAGSYLAQLYQQFGSLPLAIAAYNAGPGKVKEWMSEYGDSWSAIAPHAYQETQAEVSRVQSALGPAEFDAIAQAMAQAMQNGTLKVVVMNSQDPNRGIAPGY